MRFFSTTKLSIFWKVVAAFAVFIMILYALSAWINLRRFKGLDDSVTAYHAFNAMRDRLKEFVGMHSYAESASIYLTKLGKKISDTALSDFE